MRITRWDLPELGLGIGLRSQHVGEIIRSPPTLGFFEIISENYMDAAASSMEALDRIAGRHAVVMHGVSLSIGSTDPLDLPYLMKLRALAERTRAPWLSDHLCWTGVHGLNTHDLLPLPYTAESLAHVVERVRRIQDLLERPLFLENPSSYLEFRSSTMTELEFLLHVTERADCGLLVDVNNVHVSARNHGFDAEAYVDALPADRIVQVHIAGHVDKGTHLLDTHSRPVAEAVWALYGRLLQRVGPVSTLLEWDEDIPALATLLDEVGKAGALRAEVCRVRA